MKIPTEAELIEMEQRARHLTEDTNSFLEMPLHELDEYIADHFEDVQVVNADIERLVDLVRELRGTACP